MTMMNNLLKRIRDRFAPKTPDTILLKACREGNPHAAQVALKAGANPNTLTFMGDYGYSPKYYETQHTGTVYVTPILLAATSALGKDEDGYYQVVDLLANHPKTDLSCIVKGHRQEWRSEQHHAEGFPPTFEEDYHYSLRQVLNHRATRPSKRPEYASDLYPVSPYMLSLLGDIALDYEEKKKAMERAFSYLVDGLVAQEKAEQEKRLIAKAAEQKVASL